MVSSREFAGGSVCYYCKKRGHVMVECRTLDKKNATRKTNALVIPQDQTTPAVQIQLAETNTTPSFPKVLFLYPNRVRRYLLTF